MVYALIEGPGDGWSTLAVACGVVGVLALVAFVLVEARRAHPMVPLGIFRSRQFSGANAVTSRTAGTTRWNKFSTAVFPRRSPQNRRTSIGPAIIHRTSSSMNGAIRAGSREASAW